MKLLGSFLLLLFAGFANAKGMVFSVLEIPAAGNSYEDIAYPVDILSDGSKVAATQLIKVRSHWNKKANSYIEDEEKGIYRIIVDEPSVVIGATSDKYTFYNTLELNIQNSFILDNNSGLVQDIQLRNMVFTGASIDGTVAVGYREVGSGHIPYIWTEEGGFSVPFYMPYGKDSINAGRLLDVSGDGNIAIGSDRNGFYSYDISLDEKYYLDIPLDSYINVNDLSASGSLIVGSTRKKSGGPNQGVIWDREKGEFTLLPSNEINQYNPDGLGIILKGISDNGEVAVGDATYIHNFPDHGNNHKSRLHSTLAMAWIKGLGVVPLQYYLEEKYGYNFDGWSLRSATFISSDGTVIVGQASRADGFTRPYKIKLILLCELPIW